MHRLDPDAALPAAQAARMMEFSNYFVLGFSALLPLINPPGNALELVGIVGAGEPKTYKILAHKVAVNTVIFLTVVSLAGPYVLHFFGVSIEVLQVVGGAVLAAMGWDLLNKRDEAKEMDDPQVRLAAGECVATYWKSRAFYPLTFPITVGPGSVAVMLTLSAQANTVDISSRIPAFLGLFACVVVMSCINYVFCAYAPLITERVSSAVMHGVLRIIAFLLICVGAQIAWHGVQTLISSTHR
jgi:multiple antibiotic resistance protein